MELEHFLWTLGGAVDLGNALSFTIQFAFQRSKAVFLGLGKSHIFQGSGLISERAWTLQSSSACLLQPIGRPTALAENEYRVSGILHDLALAYVLL
jgi:hypothetical protein